MMKRENQSSWKCYSTVKRIFRGLNNMSKWIILSDNHKETGILYHIYELHKDADKFYI